MDSEFLIPIAFFAVIGYIVKVVGDNRTKRMLIEKGEVNENLKYLFADKFALAVPSSLKWGMGLIGVGFAIFISQILKAIGIVRGHDADVVMFALIFIIGGIALIAYYFLALNMAKKQETEKV